MKFGYTLGGAQNICFLQNIAENIQGKLIFDNEESCPKLLHIAVTEANQVEGASGS